MTRAWTTQRDGGLKTIARLLTTEAVANLRKFDQTRYVARAEAETAFQRYQQSDRKVFLVLGDSGKGKTNLMCALALRAAGEGPTLFTSGLWRHGSSERALGSVLGRLRTELHRQDEDVWSFVRYLHEELFQSGCQLHVFIDGINETDDYLWVRNGIREALVSCPPTIRFVLSCRTDSFRLHYQDPFWSDFVYRDIDSLPDHRIADKRSAAILERLAQETLHDRKLTEEQRTLLESAMKKHRREIGLRQVAGRDLASIVLSSFTEAEFQTAIEKYKLMARLVGEARETCHDPLMFRFFNDSLGQESREISEVFTIDNAAAYLNSQITEAQAKGHSEEDTSALIFAVARECSRRSRGGIGAYGGATLSSPREILLAETLVDSGLLLWRKWSLDGEARTVAFSFDRVLSFVLALDAKNRGRSTLIADLSRILDEEKPLEIDIHRAYYLLLFLDVIDQGTGLSRKWIAKYIRTKALRATALRCLAEVTSFSSSEMFDILREIAVKIAKQFKRAGAAATAETIDPVASVHAIAESLSILSRRGRSADAVSFIEHCVRTGYADERATLWFPFLKPLAVAFEDAPLECLPLIELICESDYELNIDRAWTRSHLSDQRSLALLKQDLERFPSARLPLIRELLRSKLASLRSLCAFAIPGLELANSRFVNEIIEALTSDDDGMVRGSVGEIVPILCSQNAELASTLCLRVVQDKDNDVRHAFVKAAVHIASTPEGANLRELLKTAIRDQASFVRSSLADALGEALNTTADTTAVETFKPLLSVLARDAAFPVRESVALAALQVAKKHPAFCVDIIIEVMSGASSELKKSIARELDSDSIPWHATAQQARTLGNILVKDVDYSVREESVPLICRMCAADRGIAANFIPQVLQDAEAQVRLKALSISSLPHMMGSIPELTEVGNRPPDANPRRRKETARYIVGLTDVKIRSLSRKEYLQRLLRNVSGTALVLSLLLAMFPGTRALGEGAIIPPLYYWGIAMFAAGVSIHVVRWLDIHFYSHQSLFLLQYLWPASTVLVLVFLVPIILPRIIPYSTADRGTLLIVSALLAAGIYAVIERWLNRPSEIWPGLSLMLVAAMGALSALIAYLTPNAATDVFNAYIRVLPALFFTILVSQRLRSTIALFSAAVSVFILMALGISSYQESRSKQAIPPLEKPSYLDFADPETSPAVPSIKVPPELVRSADSEALIIAQIDDRYSFAAGCVVLGVWLLIWSWRKNDDTFIFTVITSIVVVFVAEIVKTSDTLALLAGSTIGPLVGSLFAIVRRAEIFWPACLAVTSGYSIALWSFYTIKHTGLSWIIVTAVAVTYLALYRGLSWEGSNGQLRNRIILLCGMSAFAAAPVGYALCIGFEKILMFLQGDIYAGENLWLPYASAFASAVVVAQVFSGIIPQRRTIKWGVKFALSGCFLAAAVLVMLTYYAEAAVIMWLLILVCLIRLLIYAQRAPALIWVGGALTISNALFIVGAHYGAYVYVASCAVYPLLLVAMKGLTSRYPELFDRIIETMAFKNIDGVEKQNGAA